MPRRPTAPPALLLGGLLALPAAAQDPPPAGPLAEAAAATAGPADDLAAPLEPLEGRSDAAAATVEAAARLAAGQALLDAGDPEAALGQFLAARGVAPDSAEVLRAAVPVAIALGRDALGAELAAALSELDPDDWRLARTLAAKALEAGENEAAFRFVRRAATSPELPDAGPERAATLRAYALLSVRLNRPGDAGDAFEALLPLMSGEAGGLDFRTRRALLSDPGTAPLTVARVLLAADRPAAAAEAFGLALAAAAGDPGGVAGGPNEAPARAARAAALQRAERPEEALAELDRLVALPAGGATDPVNVLGAAATVLSQSLADLDRSAEAVPALEGWLDRHAGVDGLTLALAAARADAGDLAAAERDLRAYLAQNPDGPGRVTLASVLRQRGEPAAWLATLAESAALGEAEEPRTREKLAAAEDEAFRDAVLDAVPAVDPAPADAEGREADAAFAAEATRAELAAAAGRADEVETGLRSAARRAPDRRFDLLLTLAGVFSDADRPDDAARVVDEALADDGLDDPALGGRRAEFLVVRAQLHRDAGETDAALDKLDAAEALRPGNPFFPFQKAVALLGTDRTEETIAELERVLSLTGEGDLAKNSRLILSSLLVRRGDPGSDDARRGEELLQEQLRLTPDDPTVANDLGYLWADRGVRLGEAEALIRRALAADPENSATLDSLGWVLFKQGRLEEAKAPLLKAGKLSKNGDGTIWSHLGDLWNALGETQAARDAWRSALQRANTAEVKDERLIESLKAKLGRE